MHTKRFRFSIFFFCLFLAFITLPYGQSVVLNYIEPYLNNYLIDTILDFVQSDPQITLEFYFLFKNLCSLFLSIVSSLFFVIAITSYIIHFILKRPKKIELIFCLIISITLIIINPLTAIATSLYSVMTFLYNFIPIHISIPYIVNTIVSLLPNISSFLFFIFVLFVTWTSEIKKGFKILITSLFTILFILILTKLLLQITYNIFYIIILVGDYTFLPEWYTRYALPISRTLQFLSFLHIIFTKTFSFGCILGVLIAILKNSLKIKKKYILLYLIPFLITSLLTIAKIFCKAIYIILMIIFTNIFF